MLKWIVWLCVYPGSLRMEVRLFIKISWWVPAIGNLVPTVIC